MRTMMYACSTLAVICLTLASCGGGTSETPTSSASTEVDPCALLTAAEIEATMGVVPGEMERRESFSCQWPNPGSPFPVAYIGRFGFYMQDVSMIQVQTDSVVLITLNVRGATREQIVDLASKAVARVR